jgi:hypothetical protein
MINTFRYCLQRRISSCRAHTAFEVEEGIFVIKPLDKCNFPVDGEILPASRVNFPVYCVLCDWNHDASRVGDFLPETALGLNPFHHPM